MPWTVVITGAGAEAALQLARHGDLLVLLGRFRRGLGGRPGFDPLPAGADDEGQPGQDQQQPR